MNRDFEYNKTKPKKKLRLKKYFYMLLFLTILSISIYSFIKFDNKLKIIVLANSDIMAKTLATEAIDTSINNVIDKDKIKSEDFIIKNFDNDGNISTISANTVLINEICSNTAVKISEYLGAIGIKKIDVYLGTLTDISSFANKGNIISVDVLPSGTAEVDYDTNFYSVGINQINFQVWLNVSVIINIITPMENRKVSVNRKLTLVDTVIRGYVPPNYINTTPNDALKLIPNSN